MSGPPFYLSDCTNVYEDPSDGYPTMASACQNCSSDYAQSAPIPSNFSQAGPCSAAADSPDGNAYLSDGTNYYLCNITADDDCTSEAYAETQLSACMAPVSGPSVVGQCAATTTTEGFQLFGPTWSSHVVPITMIILSLLVGAFVLTKYLSKRR